MLRAAHGLTVRVAEMPRFRRIDQPADELTVDRLRAQTRRPASAPDQPCVPLGRPRGSNIGRAGTSV
jgi:hypothetical protein